MAPAWTQALSIAYLALGAACALVIAADELRRPQHMWIMKLVWPVTALFGTIWIVWQYFTYGRIATHGAMASKQRPSPLPDARTNLTPGSSRCHQGDTLSITAWQIGMYDFMAIAQIPDLRISYPVNWLLLHTGVKDPM